MFAKAFILSLAASPLVAAHGKVAAVVGDAGGNTTALGILGGIVPGPGKNSVTEVDTTVFSKKQAGTNPQSDGLGRTQKNGANTVEMLSLAMAQSGNTLPQVSATNGSLSGVFHIVTTDGAGPITGVLDTTGTGAFSKGTVLQTTTQVPGNKGNIKPPAGKRSFIGEIWERSLDALEARGLVKRAAKNVNTDHPVAFAIPDGTTCTGTMAGQSNVCLVKMANTNAAGPFGGVIAMQIAGGAAAAPAAPAAGAASTKATKAKSGKRFSA